MTDFSHLSTAHIVDARGCPMFLVALEQPGADTLARVRIANGPEMLVPADLFALQSDGAYRLPFSFDIPADGEAAAQRFPLVAEEVHIGKRTVDTGRGVRIHKSVSTAERIVDTPLLQEELVVEHVPIGAEIDSPPAMRYEGDTLVLPVLEEVLVVCKQLRLREEVRITRHRRETHVPQTVSLRTEHVAVERFDNSDDSGMH